MFKYLEIVANKDEKRGTGGGMGSVDASLRRNASNPTHSLKLNGSNGNSTNLLLEENQQRKKQSLDASSNGRSLEHIDKHSRSHSQDETSGGSPKWSPMHTNKTPLSESTTPVNGGQSGDLSPVGEKGGIAPLSNMQTYREYKEALKQQRNQDTTAVYRSKDNTSSSGSSSGGSNQASPMSPVNGHKSLAADVITIKPKTIIGKAQPPQQTQTVELDNSKNNNNQPSNASENGGYVKPASPMGVAKNGTAVVAPKGSDSTDSLVIKSIMNGNLRNAGKQGENNGKTGGGASAAIAAKNPKRTVSWNRDIVTPEKNISFTMRREFDRHKEEAELTGKLRNVSGWNGNLGR